MKKIILSIIFGIFLCGALACNAISPTGAPTVSDITSSIPETVTGNAMTAPASIGLAPPTTVPDQTYEEAPAIISRQSDGQVVHVNLVKYVGSLPSDNAKIFINNINIVNHDYRFYFSI